MIRISPAMSWMLGLASFVVIVAGMRAAQELIVPFLASLFLTVICYPALEWLQKKGFSTWFSLFLIILVVSISLLLVVVIVGASLQDLTSNIDEYRIKLDDRRDDLVNWIRSEGFGDLANKLEGESDVTDQGMALLRSFLADLAGLFSDIFWVLLIMIFMLMEASSFPAKLAEITGSNPGRSEQADQIRNAVWQYATLKTMISILVGGGVVLLLKILDVDYALLWGLIAFFFNFIPNVGSFLAAIPGVGMALIQYDLKTAGIAVVGYALINLVFSNIVEPKVMGKGMGISALVVFLSLIFWGWVLGPVGMILSVPLTMIVKIILETSESTRWFSILLSGESFGSEQLPSGK
ncbi:MAG: AI-2E family transporter [Planctomycetaceae bacterium]|nr:AI-2E family transporter [Planctomycetaceae bacterium]